MYKNQLDFNCFFQNKISSHGNGGWYIYYFKLVAWALKLH